MPCASRKPPLTGFRAVWKSRARRTPSRSEVVARKVWPAAYFRRNALAAMSVRYMAPLKETRLTAS